MKKFLAVFLMVMLTIPMMTSSVIAAEKASGKKIVDAGNKLCPVMGEPVSGKDFAVYQGKRYGFCCSKCKKEFLKNPEKYLGAKEKKVMLPIIPLSAEEAAKAPSPDQDAKKKS